MIGSTDCDVILIPPDYMVNKNRTYKVESECPNCGAVVTVESDKPLPADLKIRYVKCR